MASRFAGMPGAFQGCHETFIEPLAAGAVQYGTISSAQSQTALTPIGTPRTLDITFPATWDAGSLFVRGRLTDGVLAEEEFIRPPIAGVVTVQGKKGWAMLELVRNPNPGVDGFAATVKLGGALALCRRDAAEVFKVNGRGTETNDPFEFDADNATVRPATALNGYDSWEIYYTAEVYPPSAR